MELPGFQGCWGYLHEDASAEDISRESLGSLNEYFPHLESSERHLGAAREISEISWGSLQQLLGILGGLSRNVGGPWETLRQPLAVLRLSAALKE